VTSNLNGEIGLINIPSSRILKEGNLKLHLVNSEPINSLFISANPFNWMEVSLRYADVNTRKYSPYKSFSGDQTYKDKSFNLKIKLIEETDRFPELSIGFRDFIGTGKFSGEYLVTSKKIGDFDFTAGLGWGSLSENTGIKNPFINIDESYSSRPLDIGQGGDIEFKRWFKGPKASAFYGFSYLNKYSGLRFKMDYDKSNPFNLRKDSDYSFGLSIPASNFIDINIFKHRGVDIGFGLSYKADYSKQLIQKDEVINPVSFSEKDLDLLSTNDEVFSGTINVLLSKYQIFTQEIYLKENNFYISVDQTKYRNLNLAAKRVIQIIEEVLSTRKIKNVSITFQIGNVKTGSVEFPLTKFRQFLDNSISFAEIKKYILYENFYPKDNETRIFKGKVDFPLYIGGIKPDLKNHVGAPEAFYSGQIGILAAGGIILSKNSYLDSTVGIGIFQNLDQLRLKAFSRLPKVRSDVREYLKERYVIKQFSYTHMFDPTYSQDYLFFGGLKIGLFEEMYGGIGGEILFRDIKKPWYLTANYYWVKQREFNQRFSFRNYETFTGHLNFIWETPLDGVKMILSGGRYLARDSGITLNMSKTFKTGFTIGFFATKTDISAFEFGEGSFDKGIYFSIPLDLVSSKYRKNNARFVWKNLTRDGGAMLSGTLDLSGFVENSSSNFLNYFNDGFYQ
tara:strand:- start:4396 stop:6429 length:2034 start_codon:yes stop_codon:yes gene_type:complete